MLLKIRHETGLATTFQFIVISGLNLINALTTSVHICTAKSGNCLSGLLLPILYFIGVTLWFASLWILGFFAQEKRSKRLCQLLIAAESLVALVALFDLKHSHTGYLTKIISLTDILLALWVALVAFRLLRARGGRVRKHNI